MPKDESWRFEEPELVRFTSPYVRRLLIEWHNIRAKIENPGGSVILTATARVDPERINDYSTEIGNSYHLDILNLQEQLATMPKNQVEALMSWAEGMTSDQAALYLNARGGVTIRKRRERGLKNLTKKMEILAYGPE